MILTIYMLKTVGQFNCFHVSCPLYIGKYKCRFHRPYCFNLVMIPILLCRQLMFNYKLLFFFKDDPNKLWGLSTINVKKQMSMIAQLATFENVGMGNSKAV